MEVVLRQDVDHVGLRGEVVNVARGYARNYLLPRGLAEVATPGLKRELERRDALKARNEAKTTDEAAGDREAARGDGAQVRGERRPDRLALRLGHGDERRRPALGGAEDPRRPAQARTCRRSSASAATRSPAEVFADVTAELRLLVVPEGGELPPEEPEVVEAAVATEAAAPAAEAAAVDRGRSRPRTPRPSRGGRGRGRARPRPSRRGAEPEAEAERPRAERRRGAEPRSPRPSEPAVAEAEAARRGAAPEVAAEPRTPSRSPRPAAEDLPRRPSRPTTTVPRHRPTRPLRVAARHTPRSRHSPGRPRRQPGIEPSRRPEAAGCSTFSTAVESLFTALFHSGSQRLWISPRTSRI